MAKLLIQNNLKLVCGSRNSFRGISRDGVYSFNKGYFVTCCHGNEDGSISLQINDKITQVNGETIRKEIHKSMNVKINKNESIWIIPCYPKRVKRAIGDDLKRNNIFLACNNWDGITTFRVYKEGYIVANSHDVVTKEDSIAVLFGKRNDLLRAINNGLVGDTIKI